MKSIRTDQLNQLHIKKIDFWRKGRISILSKIVSEHLSKHEDWVGLFESPYYTEIALIKSLAIAGVHDYDIYVREWMFVIGQAHRSWKGGKRALAPWIFKFDILLFIFLILEHKTGIDLTVSSTLKKPSKNYTCFISRHFGLFLIHLQSKNKATNFFNVKCFYVSFDLAKWKFHNGFHPWKNPSDVLGRAKTWNVLQCMDSLLRVVLEELVHLQQACTTQKARRAKLININSPRAAKVYFVIVWKKFWKDK